MITSYNLNIQGSADGAGGRIEFETNDTGLFDRLAAYVNQCVDAFEQQAEDDEA